MNYKDDIAQFIQQELLHGRTTKLEEDQDLLGAGIVDSLGILRLVAFMEETLGISVRDGSQYYPAFSVKFRERVDYSGFFRSCNWMARHKPAKCGAHFFACLLDNWSLDAANVSNNRSGFQ